jgi:hypothetical protein
MAGRHISVKMSWSASREMFTPTDPVTQQAALLLKVHKMRVNSNKKYSTNIVFLKCF